MKKRIGSLFRYLKNIVKGGVKDGVKEPIKALSVWFAFLSLFVGLHGDIFEQEEGRIWAAVVNPWQRIFSPNPKPVNLSDLLYTSPEAANEKELPLYIFALDVSSSMNGQKVSKEELNQYLGDIKDSIDSNGPASSMASALRIKGKEVSTFDIARLEICRYLYSVPNRSRVALWTFGESSEQVWPDLNPEGNRYDVYDKNDKGGHTRLQIENAVLRLRADGNKTDFEDLLSKLAERYQDEVEEKDEIHFVIISDFVHDIGGGEYLKEITGNHVTNSSASIWESRYRISATRISDQLRELAKDGNKVFHLAAVFGARRVLCAILPIVGETLEMYRFREVQLMPNKVGKEFDFLRSYEESKIPLTFFYTPGDFKPMPTKILINGESYQNCSLRFSLASDAQIQESLPLKIKTRFEPGGDNKEGVLRLNGSGYSGKIERNEDTISLEPVSTLEPREASTYRLLISLEGRNGATADVSHRKTFAVRVQFYKRLSLLSAITLVVFQLFVSIFTVWSAIRFVKTCKEAKHGETSG